MDEKKLLSMMKEFSNTCYLRDIINFHLGEKKSNKLTKKDMAKLIVESEKAQLIYDDIENLSVFYKHNIDLQYKSFLRYLKEPRYEDRFCSFSKIRTDKYGWYDIKKAVKNFDRPIYTRHIMEEYGYNCRHLSYNLLFTELHYIYDNTKHKGADEKDKFLDMVNHIIAHSQNFLTYSERIFDRYKEKCNNWFKRKYGKGIYE